MINGQDRDLRILVVGGGATGVETAGALAELRNNDLPITFPELNPDRTHITLVEQSPFLLAPFHPHLREYARTSLEKRGVDLRLDTSVKQVRPDGVILDDQSFVPADVVVWASGVHVHDQVARWNVPQGRGGRIAVDNHLRVIGLDGVFAVGDIAGEGGNRALPQLAQPARQGGAYVAAQLSSQLTGKKTNLFKYHDKGALATIGRNSAVAQAKGLPRLTGFVAWVMWIVIHVFSLLGNRNRLATMLNLSARYLFWHRSHNAIVGETPATILDHPSNVDDRGLGMVVQRHGERRQPIMQRDLMPCSAYADGAIWPRRFLVAGQTDSTDRRSDALVPRELGTFDPAWPGRLLPMVMRSERQESVVCELFGDLGIAGHIRQGR